jgi:CRP/FNR family cyclic AMP-dependent transcriptional regulator
MREQNHDAWKIAQESAPKWPRASFLAKLKEPVKRDFLTSGELVNFRKGEALIREGEAASDVFLLLDAIVKVTARLDAGGQALLAVRAGGDAVGEIAFLDEVPRTATVSASGNQPSFAVRLDQGTLSDLLARHPGAAKLLTSAIIRKFRSATQRRVDISGCKSKVCMARALLEIAEDCGHSAEGGTFIGVNLTQMELGTLVGVSESTAHRALRALRRDKVIVSTGQRLLVPDMAMLRSMAWAKQPQAVR